MYSRAVRLELIVVALSLMTGCRDATTAKTIDAGSAPRPASSLSASPAPSAAATPSAADAGGAAQTREAEDRACLAAHYDVPADVPYDDGKKKTTAERIDSPDLDDVFAVPYPTPGTAITPVTDEEIDPGRIRVESMFRATYGMTARDVEAALVNVKIAGHTVRFHRRGAADALRRVAKRIDALLAADPSLGRFFKELGGTFNPRNIAGTTHASAHSWGVAIDIDTSLSDYWRHAGPNAKVVWRNRIPQSIVDAFEAEAFVWGGRWYHYDTMHFEYRPELFDARCRRP